MKRVILILGLLVFVFTSCQKLKSFHSIYATDQTDVDIQIGNKYQISGDYEKDEYYIEDDKIVIQGQADVVLTIPSDAVISSIEVDSSADLKMDDDYTLNSTSLNIKISGEGDAKLNIKAKAINVQVLQQGDLELSSAEGSTVLQVNLISSGSGTYKASKLIADNYSVILSNEADAYVYANNKIQGLVTDNAHLYYSGNATVDVQTEGNGTVSEFEGE